MLCGSYYHPIVIVGGIIQTVLYSDFFYVYYIDKKKKGESERSPDTRAYPPRYTRSSRTRTTPRYTRSARTRTTCSGTLHAALSTIHRTETARALFF